MVKLIEELVFGKNIERTKHNHSLRGVCTNTNCSESEPAIEIDFEKVIRCKNQTIQNFGKNMLQF